MEQKLKTDFDKFISTSNFSNQEIKFKKEASFLNLISWFEKLEVLINLSKSVFNFCSI